MINADTTASGTGQDPTDRHAIVSDVQRDVGNRVVNIHGVVSGVHHNKLETCEVTDGQNNAAITTRVRPTTKQTFATAQTHARLVVSLVSGSNTEHSHSAHPENPCLRFPEVRIGSITAFVMAFPRFTVTLRAPKPRFTIFVTY